ncbi:IpaD/SipD/SspD family type III secretion system needle tip protein [Cedecea davisae]|uniref:IpaD/SipD/SspD family type III secretion system needle tip protein n=1 Tax=Cedecea davisae TaxID=158484 RepID=UPI00243073E6|nr:IpaD/SipD/SspD family type III secretion system needle tip protein [Cedecea davisae]
MDISNHYLTRISSAHGLQPFTNNKDALSSINENDGGHKTVSGNTNESVISRLLNKPIVTVMTERNKLNHMLKTGQTVAFNAELGAMKARTALVSREVSSRMDVLRNSGAPEMKASLPLPADQRTSAGPAIDMSVFLRNLSLLSPDVQLDGAEQENSLFDALKNANASGTSGPNSSWNICESVADAIGSMGDGYLDVFQQAVEKYAAFYSDFSDFISKLKDYMLAGDDGAVTLDADKFLDALQKLMDKYKSGDNSRLYPVNGGASKEECEAWCKEMGLDPDKCLKRVGGSYQVCIDTSPLQEIYNSVTYKEVNVGDIHEKWMECNSAQWAAWQAGLDMQKDNVQTGMQTLTQKYSNANSTFDNLVKVLSSTITSLLDCDKNFFNI